ncbi:hypothetical protein, partial [Caenimonas koreensis]|uniref:hypothetical protein n=1 Tax=Caenimonas koreensis TaxID=367474 RepID=UPI001E40179F
DSPNCIACAQAMQFDHQPIEQSINLETPDFQSLIGRVEGGRSLVNKYLKPNVDSSTAIESDWSVRMTTKPSAREISVLVSETD